MDTDPAQEKEAPEEVTEPKEVKQTSPKKQKVAKPVVEGSRSSTRERKVVEVFSPVVASEALQTELVVPEGEGSELGEIENVAKRLDSYKAADPFLKQIHKILYPGQKCAVKNNIKKNIRLFKGYGKETMDKVKADIGEKLVKMEAKKYLKPMCSFFDLEVSGNKEELSERIISFLCKPAASGKEYKSVTKGGTKRKKSTKKSTKKAKKVKKSSSKKISGYMMFVQANRDAVKKKNPEASFGDIGKLLGKSWNKLDEEEKAKWKEQGLEASGKSSTKKSQSKPKKAKKPASSEEEESDEDSDAPLAMKAKGLGDKLETKIKEILTGADLSALSVKKIKEQLVVDFGEELIESKKKEIREFINKTVQAS